MDPQTDEVVVMTREQYEAYKRFRAVEIEEDGVRWEIRRKHFIRDVYVIREDYDTGELTIVRRVAKELESRDGDIVFTFHPSPPKSTSPKTARTLDDEWHV